MTGGGDDTDQPLLRHATPGTTPTTASGAKTVTATNGAGLTSTDTFTVTPDTTAPSGQTVDLSGGPWYTSLSVPLTLDWGSDAGSGLDALEPGRRARRGDPHRRHLRHLRRPGRPVTLVGGADTTVTSGNCYRYRVQRLRQRRQHQRELLERAPTPRSTPARRRVAVTAPTAVTGAGNQYYDSGTDDALVPADRLRLVHAQRDRDATPSPASTTSPSPTSPASPAGRGSTGGNDTTSPYASPDRLQLDRRARPRSARRRSPPPTAPACTAADTLTISADSTAPDRPDASHLTGGPWYTSLSVAAHARQRQRRRLRPRHRRAASSSAPRRRSPTAPAARFGSWTPVTLVGGADTTVTERQLLPLPLHDLRPRRQRSAPSSDERERQGRHDRAERARPDAERVLRRSPTSPARPSTTTPRARTPASFTVDATSTDAQSGIAEAHTSRPSPG